MQSEAEKTFNIKISENGEFSVTDACGEKLSELSPEELGKSLIGREIKDARSINITFLSSNPRWICIGGRWYRIG